MKQKKAKRADAKRHINLHAGHQHLPASPILPVLTAKRRLAPHEEFEIMKIVLDKFLWIGTGLMAFGLYRTMAVDFQDGLWYILTGTLLMVAFAWFIVKEFERIR